VQMAGFLQQFLGHLPGVQAVDRAQVVRIGAVARNPLAGAVQDHAQAGLAKRVE